MPRNRILFRVLTALTAAMLAALPLNTPAARAKDTDSRSGGAVLDLSLEDAVVLSLRNNQSLIVQRFDPAITRTAEEKQKAVFDPVLGWSVEGQRTRSPSAEEDAYESSDSLGGGLSLEKSFPAGTTVELDISSDINESPQPDKSRVGITATRPLLRDSGSEVNLVSIRQARLDTDISIHELRGFAESLVAQVEEAYWDLALAEKEVDISGQSLELAENQVEETRERIRVGKLAGSELVAAEAEAALRLEALINARSKQKSARLKLMRLVNPPGKGLWDREVRLLDQPVIPEGSHLDLDIEELVNRALVIRPDINQARLQLEQGDLEIVRTKNGLLPRLDVFITLGKTGYSDSFGGSLGDTLDGEGFDVRIGLNGEFPWKNRSAKATHGRAILDRRRAAEALENLSQLVQLDIRSAFVEAVRLKEQVTATAATLKLQEEKLRAETEKFRVGKSTSFLVAQAQRDLVASRTSEAQSVASYLKALVELYRLEGALLDRRGIAIQEITGGSHGGVRP